MAGHGETPAKTRKSGPTSLPHARRPSELNGAVDQEALRQRSDRRHLRRGFALAEEQQNGAHAGDRQARADDRVVLAVVPQRVAPDVEPIKALRVQTIWQGRIIAAQWAFRTEDTDHDAAADGPEARP